MLFVLSTFFYENLFLLRKLNDSEWTLLNRIENIAVHSCYILRSFFFFSSLSPFSWYVVKSEEIFIDFASNGNYRGKKKIARERNGFEIQLERLLEMLSIELGERNIVEWANK